MNVEEFRQKLFECYNRDVGLPDAYYFIDGNPVEPVAPRDTAQGGVFVLGAYPSAIFETRNGVCDVPVANIARPFDLATKSGQELDDHYLWRLGLSRDQCWITNLVRTFLFKDGHVEKYKRLGCANLPPVTRHQFEMLARFQKNLDWLQMELEFAAPKAIITLGAEVAGILRRVKSQKARNALLGGNLQQVTVGDQTYPAIHLAHPGITMRTATPRNPWPDLHKEHSIAAAGVINDLLADRPGINAPG